MGKSAEWVRGENRRYVLSAEDIPELERDAGIHEFVNKRPREEAESAAYSSYRKKNLTHAAAHHLASMKAASASGSYKEAKKHKLVYDMILNEIGLDPNDHTVPDEIQNILNDPEHNPGLRFKAHKGDAFLLNKSEEPIYIQPEWQLSPNELTLEALKSLPRVLKSTQPLGKNDSPLQVNFLTNKLRQMRDWFDTQGIQSINERDVPEVMRQQLSRVGRDYQGNFNRARIQEMIDAAPPRDYNFSTGQYTSAMGATQRHSKEPSNVFRLEMTPKIEEEMRQAGVLDAYRRMAQLSQDSKHPVTPGTLGWVRWTGDKSGVHVDEVQSDYGRPWPAYFTDQFSRYARRGDIRESDVPRHVESFLRDMPEEQRKLIQKIGFGNKHPAEVLSEAFHQWARTHGGLEGAPVHIWQPEAKAYMAVIDPFYEGNLGDLATFDYTRPIPGHLQTAYRDVPGKQGMVEGQYGEIPTQSTAKFKRAPPKAAVGKIGGDIQWRPSTKTYKDVIRGVDKTPAAPPPEAKPKKAKKVVEKSELAEKLLALVKSTRSKLAPKVEVEGVVQRGSQTNLRSPTTDKKGKRDGSIEYPFTVEQAKKSLELVKEMRNKLNKGDVIPFPVDRAKAATVPPAERAGEVAGIRQNDPKDHIRRMHEAFHKMPLPELEETLRHYYRRPEDDVEVHSGVSESQIARHVYKVRTQPDLNKGGMLGAMSNAGIKPSQQGGATGNMMAPPKGMDALKPESNNKPGGLGPIGAANSTMKLSEDKPEEKPVERRKEDRDDFKGAPKRKEDDAWAVTPKNYKGEKPYTGRDEAFVDHKKSPGTPGAKIGSNVIPDKKKVASKEAARKYRPGQDD